MALQRDSRYPGRFTPATTAHPQGAFKNRSTPTSQDGSYLESDWANDWSGFFEALLTKSGVTPNNVVDTATSSQYLFALETYARAISNGVVGETRNLRASLTSSSASLNFTADEIILETSVGALQYRIGGFNKIVNLSTTGAGGMDTGSAPASGWVAVYAIYNPTTNVQSILATNVTNTIAPSIYGGSNLPTGYTATALISVWRTNSSGIFQIGHQRGRKFVTPRVDVLTANSNPGGYTAIGLSQAVPQNAVTCTGYAFCNSGTGAGAATLVLASDTSGSGFFQAYAGTTGAIGTDIYFEMLLPVVQNIYYQFSWTTSGVSNALVGISGYTI